jgi:hypothetical protein
MTDQKRFTLPGSPLNGKVIPLDWGRMTPNAKRRALVDYQYARTWEEAGTVLGKHHAAIRATRRESAARTARGLDASLRRSGDTNPEREGLN